MHDPIKTWGLGGKGYRLRDHRLIKGMKAAHLLAAIAWGGGAFAMQALGALGRSVSDAQSAALVAHCSWFVDTWVVMPGLFGCILTGLFYSLYTSIGFFRFAWIGYKWLVTASACFWGLLFWSKLGDRLIEYAAGYGLDWPLVFARGLILPANAWASLVQTLIILSMCLISVYRPVSFTSWLRRSETHDLSARMAALHRLNAAALEASPLANPQAQALYDNWLGEPMGPQSKGLLHMKLRDKSARIHKLQVAGLYPQQHKVN